MIYRQSNYQETKAKFVQIGPGMFVVRSYISKVSPTGIVTFKDGSSYKGYVPILVHEGLL